MRLSHWSLCASAMTLAILLPAAESANAQVFYQQWSYYGHSYPRQPVYIRPVPLPPDEISDIMVEDHRYRRVGRPQFAGHIYVVDGVDRTGAVVRSYVDAFNGRLIDVDVLQLAPRQAAPGRRIARLPDGGETPRALPTPPRRPTEARPSRPEPGPAPRQAARTPPAAPAAPPATAPAVTAPSSSPIVPLSREPRVVNPAEVRLQDEADKAPPMARPSQPAPALVTPPQSTAAEPAIPRAAAPPQAPGASPVAPAPLDDAVRRPTAPSGPPVPAAPLL